MDARLIVLEGEELKSHEFKLSGIDFVIGRSASCDLAIDHSRVSLEHCRITRRDDGRIVLEDLHSTYGTFLNDRDVELSTLHDGDTIRVGPAVLLCAFGSEASESRRRVLERYDEQSRRDSMLSQRGRLVDPNDDSPIVSSAKQIFDRIIHHGEEFEDDSARQRAVTTKPVSVGKSRRVEIEDNEGVAHVNLLDRAIIHDLEIQQISSELEDLISGGQRKILVDFGNVKHMSSQAVGVLIQAQRRLKSMGGLLKVCNPNPEVAQVFKITNLTRAIEIHVDEQAAFRAGWPDTANEGPVARAVASAQAALQADPRTPPVSSTPKSEKSTLRVELVIEVGRSKGKTIPINRAKYLIGRDPSCQLRPASEAISREHTRIEVRGGKVFVRDLGTTNGTLLGDHLLLGEEAEAHDGDRLQIGPLSFRFSIEKQSSASLAAPTGGEEDAAASWLLQGKAVPMGDTAMFAMPDVEAAAQARQRALDEIRRIKHRVVGETTVVTILAPTLQDEEQIGPVRHELLALMNEPVPKRVVLRMKKVHELSSLGIAMLLGHFQRLDRLGGGLRLCELQTEVAAPVEDALMTSPVSIYSSAEDAIRDPWPMT